MTEQSPEMAAAVERVKEQYGAKPQMVYCSCWPGACEHFREREQNYERLTAALADALRLAKAEGRAEQQTTIENLEHHTIQWGDDEQDTEYAITLNSIEDEGEKLEAELEAARAAIGAQR